MLSQERLGTSVNVELRGRVLEDGLVHFNTLRTFICRKEKRIALSFLFVGDNVVVEIVKSMNCLA